jgi:hypothetical protein
MIVAINNYYSCFFAYLHFRLLFFKWWGCTICRKQLLAVFYKAVKSFEIIFLALAEWKVGEMLLLSLSCLSILPSSSLHVATQVLNGFSWNVIRMSFIKIQHIPSLVKIIQQYWIFYVKTYMHFFVHLKSNSHISG